MKKNGCSTAARVSIALGCAVFCGFVATDARGDSILVTSADWTGYRVTPAITGVDASDGSNWDAIGVKVAWTITHSTTTGLYTYTYTLTSGSDGDLVGGVSHFIIETSPSFTSANVKSGSSTVTAPQTWNPSDTNGAQPYMPDDLFGVKFDFGGSQPVYTLVTDRAPIWGDFYTKDGKGGQTSVFNAAWNTGFGTDPTSSTSSFANWIPTPDTLSGDPNPNVLVPLPAAAWMGVLLLGGMGGLRTLKKRREPATL